MSTIVQARTGPALYISLRLKMRFCRGAFVLYKVYLVCEEKVEEKTTRNDAGFINDSNTIYFPGIWLDNCGYVINQWEKNEVTLYLLVFKMVIIKKVIKLLKFSGNNEI